VPSERDNSKRAGYRRRVSGLDVTRLIFLDETAINTAMTRRFGRAPSGQRASEIVPRNYGEHLSCIGALSLSGLVASMTVQGAVDTLAFDAYVREILAPCLRMGDIVVLDNLYVHKASEIEEEVARRGGRVVWLPPYSPDYSPIEQCWSKIKACLRRLKARTYEQLYEALKTALELITESDIRGWFNHCGYQVASD
jgi:transposase